MRNAKFLLSLLLLGAVGSAAAAPALTGSVNSGDVAWMIVATILVLMMSVPGLALFYSGLVRMKNAIAMQVQVLVCFALVMLAWLIFGYALTFSDFLDVTAIQQKLLFIGIGADAVVPGAEAGRLLPTYVYALFQGAFAAITCALVLGAMAERARLGGVVVFSLLWLLLSYIPIAHMVWHHTPGAGGKEGLMASWGVLDFAGGLVVHVNAGVAGLFAAYMLDRRQGFGSSPLAPHSLNSVLTGTALLWLGWVGFNAGSALGTTSLAGLAFMNTIVASCTACLVWAAIDRLHYGRTTALGAASGALAGLIGVTPAAGFVAPWAALVIGAVAAFFSFKAIGWVKRKMRIDDALDVFAIHGVSGLVGSLLVGVFAFKPLGGTVEVAAQTSLMQAIGGQVLVQGTGTLAVIFISALGTFIALWVADSVTNLRLDDDQEMAGLDAVDHAETAYNFLNE